MYQNFFSSVTRKIIEDVHTATCDVDFDPWIKFCTHIQGKSECKIVHYMQYLICMR